MPATWQEKLHAAESESEVLHLARNFLATFTPFEISQLPEPCRPRKILDSSDLMEYAFDLVRHRCDDGVGAEYAAHRLSAFFSGAASRLAQILHTKSQGESSRSETA